MTNWDQPVLYLIWRLKPWKPLHPVFNPVWCSVTDIEKSKKSAVTDVPCSQTGGVLGKVSFISQWWCLWICTWKLILILRVFEMEAKGRLLNYVRFIVSWVDDFERKQWKWRNSLLSSVYWSLVLYQCCSKTRKQKSGEITLENFFKKAYRVLHCWQFLLFLL